MSLEKSIDALTAAIVAATAAFAGKPSAVPAETVAANAKKATPAAPAAPALNKDGETAEYAEKVKPVFLALLKSHGRDFAIATLAPFGLKALLEIKAGEKTPGQYKAITAALTEAAKQPSPLAPADA